MRTYEVVNKGTTRFALTVNKYRVTVKVQKDSGYSDRMRILEFFRNIIVRPEMQSPEFTMRGRVNIPPKDIPLLITLKSESGNVQYTYREDIVKADRQQALANQ